MLTQDGLDKLRRSLDEALALREEMPDEQMPDKALFDRVDAIGANVRAATADITRAVSDGEPAPIAEMQALVDTFEKRWRRLPSLLLKLLHRPRESVRAALERVTFLDLSRGKSAPCDCALWRAVAKGGGLSNKPTLSSSRIVEDVNDQFECYRILECNICKSRWLEDDNPDSDPSTTRWWAR